MRLNKAQISYFLILGLILIFVIGIGFYFIGNLKGQKAKETAEKVQQISLEAQPVKIYIDECIKKVAAETAYEFGQRQGYHDVHKPNLDTNYSNIAYYYHKGNNIVPSKDVLEKEFSKILDENLLIDCTDFSIFENLGYGIEFDDLNSTIQILKDNLIVNVNYPLLVEKNGLKSSIGTFSYTLPFRIGHIIDVSNDLVNSIVDEPYALDLTLLLNFDVGISVVHRDNCDDIYIIVDNESKAKPSDDDYVFTFAVGLEDQYCKDVSYQETKLVIPYPTLENHDPILDPIPYLIADVNQEFTHKLNAFDEDSDTLFYLTDGILQNYTNVLTGFINFTPKENQIGINFINATVVDIKSGMDSKQFYVEIK